MHLRIAASGSAGEEHNRSKTLSEGVARVLREEIVCGQWRPNEKLKTDDLKARFGMSSATIRDALFILMAESLVRLEGQKGFRVTPMDVDDAQDLARTRAIVESAALEESIRVGDDGWEALVTAEYFLLARAENRMKDDPSGALETYELANERFHEALVSASSSERLKTMRRTLFQEAKRYRRIVVRNPQAMGEDAKEHEQLFRACIGRELESAKKLIVGHVHSSVSGISASDFEIAAARTSSSGAWD